MNKAAFLEELRRRLKGLPESELEERLMFYCEMIDDRLEDGLTEEEAVAAVGPADAVVEQIMEDVPLTALVKEKVRKKRSLSGGTLALIILGAPLWLPLLIAAFAVMLSLYLSIWAVLISFWAVFVSFAAGALAGPVGAVVYLIKGRPDMAAFVFGCGLASAGLAIFTFFGCRALTKGILKLTKKMLLGIKTLFIGKEASAS